MTAEIAVMNKLGIALAADSAGSVETPRGIKTYGSNKLFTLSKFHPVGIMINGNSALMGVPLEIIIKSYRHQLHDKSCDTLEEYVSEFFAHLDNNTFYFPPELQKEVLESIAVGYYEIITEQIDEAVQEITNTGKTATVSDIKKIVAECIKQNLDFISSFSRLTSVPVNLETNVLRDYDTALDDAIKFVFKRLPLSATSIKQLKTIVAELCVRDTFGLSEDRSGLITAGFGEREFYPSVAAHQIEFVIDGHLKRSDNWCVRIDSDKLPAKVMAFAQREMVTTFLHGVSPLYKDTLEEYLTELFDEYPDAIAKTFPAALSPVQKKKLVNDLKSVGKQLVGDFLKRMENISSDYSLGPILEGVQNLPLDELALMAESLVNLTSFKRRVSLDMETVGGPIDVAVISKGDGFIWIKRKHYFEAQMNPHFFKNYYNS